MTYLTWPTIEDLFPVSFPGVKTSRDDVVIDIDRNSLITRMKVYFDPSVSDAEIRRRMPGAMDATQRFDAVQTRQILVTKGNQEDAIRRFAIAYLILDGFIGNQKRSSWMRSARSTSRMCSPAISGLRPGRNNSFKATISCAPVAAVGCRSIPWIANGSFVA
jgi:hypothetical protein